MKLALIAVVFAVFAPSCWAAGGTCPTSANYTNPSTGAQVTLASLGVTSCFYIAASGSDASNGTSEATPWLHAPGMTGCTGTCSSASIAAGEGFILRGGDTYHFSGRGTPVGLPWTWTHSGNSGSPIYLGVDRTWFSAASWARPVFTGDNPTSTSTVGSCAHADDGETFLSSSVNNVIVDNFEATGFCWATGNGLNIFDGGSSNFTSWTNNYIHGWTRQSSCTGSGCGQSPQGFFTSNGAVTCPGGAGCSDTYTLNVVDGADTEGDVFTAIQWQCYNVYGNVFRFVANIVCNIHNVHDNWLDNFNESPTSDHGNTWEENTEITGVGANAWYNNLVTNNNTAVQIWLAPPPGNTVYVFNNIIYGAKANAQGNYFNVGDNTNNYGTYNVFNNTFENPNNGAIIQCQETAHLKTINLVNNFYINNSSPYAANPCPSANGGGNSPAPLTELTLSHSLATSDGYVASQVYAYSPTSSSNPTVGAGTNETSGFCSALSGNAATACTQDASYACTYNSVNHTVSCPARTPNPRPGNGAGNWDIGGYAFGSSSSSKPNPPTNLSVAVQ